MPDTGPRRVAQRARTAAGLPGRVVAVEDRCAALELGVAAKIDEMRAELAEIRSLLTAVLATESDVAALVGTMLSANRERLDALEDRLGDPGDGSDRDAEH